jgi:hypothetical protein
LVFVHGRVRVKVLTLSPTPCPFVKLGVVPTSRIGSLVPRR